MTLKEFSLENEITGVQYVDGIIFNVICGETPYGLDVDTSLVPSGTMLLTTTDFVLTETELIVNDVTLNLFTTNIIG